MTETHQKITFTCEGCLYDPKKNKTYPPVINFWNLCAGNKKGGAKPCLNLRVGYGDDGCHGLPTTHLCNFPGQEDFLRSPNIPDWSGEIPIGEEFNPSLAHCLIISCGKLI